MKKVEDKQFIATVEFNGALFLEDKQKFQSALKQGGYLLHQDEFTGEYEIYKEED